MEQRYKISLWYPQVEQTHMKSVEDNGWTWNRLR